MEDFSIYLLPIGPTKAIVYSVCAGLASFPTPDCPVRSRVRACITLCCPATPLVWVSQLAGGMYNKQAVPGLILRERRAHYEEDGSLDTLKVKEIPDIVLYTCLTAQH